MLFPINLNSPPFNVSTLGQAGAELHENVIGAGVGDQYLVTARRERRLRARRTRGDGDRARQLEGSNLAGHENVLKLDARASLQRRISELFLCPFLQLELPAPEIKNQ